MFGPHFRPGFAWGGAEDPEDFGQHTERPTIDEQIGYHWGPGPFHPPFRGPFGRPFFRGPFRQGPFHHMMRGGPFNFGRGPRMFGRGDLKYALLGLLEEHPKHGYEMIKDLENRSGGFYSPSAGAIYPTLQLLEDRDWVSVEVIEGKKVYTITNAGRQALRDYAERPGGPGPFGGPGFDPGGPGFGPFGPHGHHHERGERGPRGREDWGEHRRGRWGPFGWETAPELRALAYESRDVAHLMRDAVVSSARDSGRLRELRGIIERVRGELLTFLSRGPSDQPQQPQQPQQPGEEPGKPDQPASGEGPVEHL